jgi:MoxR-like ATPase
MNANDLVLEALLGILNERRFVQGEQQEDARLHTALAMTNHLKYTAISEPVLDRFMFKASIDPHGDALNDIRIDLAYARHHGHPIPPEHRIPLHVLRELSDVVVGDHLEHEIEASHDILFLKNELIETYTRMLRVRDDGTLPRSASPAAMENYISPRTKAACRDVLNASALLQHRTYVTSDDLHSLRFVLTTVPGNDRTTPDPSQEVFQEAIDATLHAFATADLETVREITTIAQTFNLYLHGETLETQQGHRGIIRLFLALIGRSSWQEVDYDTFVDALRGKQIANPRVNTLREEILDEILEHSRDSR